MQKFDLVLDDVLLLYAADINQGTNSSLLEFLLLQKGGSTLKETRQTGSELPKYRILI